MPDTSINRIAFVKLKQKVNQQFAQNTHIQKNFTDWSMTDIYDFQEDLKIRCTGSVSEKWIYLHFKNENDKLPRIDVLNLLSNYCGYKSWSHFLQLFNEETSHSTSIDSDNLKSHKGKLRLLAIVLVVLTVIIFCLVHYTSSISTSTTLMFRDAYTRELIPIDNLNFSPSQSISNSHSSHSTLTLSLPLPDSFQVSGAYLKSKNIKSSTLKNSDTNWIDIYPDDYALMLNFYSRSSTDNIEKRRSQLMEAVHDDAKIFHVHPKLKGLEILNKQEFIDRLTLPINTLKNLDILHIEYNDHKIYKLRFIQKTDLND